MTKSQSLRYQGIVEEPHEPTTLPQAILRAIDTRKERHSFVTHNQVTGWRFLLRRIVSAIVLGDTRMIIDPVREQMQPVKVGSLLAVTTIIGCLMFSFLKPTGSLNNHYIFSDRNTKNLYVSLEEKLYPVFNLTSAQLIIGKNETPKEVASAVIASQPHGNLIGIAGAPESIQQTYQPADWSVCQQVTTMQMTVIGKTQLTKHEQLDQRIADHQTVAYSLTSNEAILVRNHKALWFVWNNHRSLIHREQRAVAQTFQLDYAPIINITDQLLNLIPQAPDILVPSIPGINTHPAYLDRSPFKHVRVGSVIETVGTEHNPYYYLVLAQGIEPIPAVLFNSIIAARPTAIIQAAPAIITSLPRTHMLDTTAYPAIMPTYVDPSSYPITCVRWQKDHNQFPARSSLLVGSHLPAPEHWFLHSTPSTGQLGTAHTVIFEPGKGYLAQLTGNEAYSSREESLMWIGDNGERYPIPGTLDVANPVLKSLGLHGPSTFIPPAISALLPEGSILSRDNALQEYHSHIANVIPVKG